MRERDRKSIEIDKMLPQFTTMNVIEGQAGLVNYSSLILYSLTLNNILNIIAIRLAIVTTTIRTIPIPTMVVGSYSNTISDDIFYGIYPVKVLVLKRFIPS